MTMSRDSTVPNILLGGSHHFCYIFHSLPVKTVRIAFPAEVSRPAKVIIMLESSAALLHPSLDCVGVHSNYSGAYEQDAFRHR